MRFFPFFLFGQIMATSSEAGQADSCVQATGSKPSAGAGSGGGAAEVKVEGANGVEKKEPSPAGAAAAAVDGQSQAKKEKKQEDGAKQRLRILCVEKGTCVFDLGDLEDSTIFPHVHHALLRPFTSITSLPFDISCNNRARSKVYSPASSVSDGQPRGVHAYPAPSLQR